MAKNTVESKYRATQTRSQTMKTIAMLLLLLLVGCGGKKPDVHHSVSYTDCQIDMRLHQDSLGSKWWESAIVYDKTVDTTTMIVSTIYRDYYKGWETWLWRGRDRNQVSIVQKFINDSGYICSVKIEVRRPITKEAGCE